MTRFKSLVLTGWLAVWVAEAQQVQPLPQHVATAAFVPLKVPEQRGLFLQKGDRLAICGDSITEQKMYSRIIEDYLTMCVPDLQVTVRQYGWSGERAPGFLARMTNDCLRFNPTVATTCYGMNDHEYRPYETRIGVTYARYTMAIDEAFKANGVRVIQGSAGPVGKMPSWVKSANGTVQDLNANLCTLRNIGLECATTEHVRFADVFVPMLSAGVEARRLYGLNYAIAGKDGVHPGWAGHAVMAYAFLKAMGLDGEIGTLTVDLSKMTMKTSGAHEVFSSYGGEFEIRSSAYPFCPCAKAGTAAANYPVCEKDDPTKDDSIRSAMTLIPFNQELNRFMLVVTGGKARAYAVKWEGQSKTFSAEQLQRGVNLAEEFPVNPFSEAFAKVDAAVAAKQAFETKQIKDIFHGAEGKADMRKAVERTEKERAPLATAIQTAFVPVMHRIAISPR